MDIAQNNGVVKSFMNQFFILWRLSMPCKLRLLIACAQTVAFLSPFFGTQALKQAMLDNNYFMDADDRIAAIDALVPVGIGVINVGALFAGPVVAYMGSRVASTAALLGSAAGFALCAAAHTSAPMYAAAAITSYCGGVVFWASLPMVLDIDPIIGLGLLMAFTEASALPFALMGEIAEHANVKLPYLLYGLAGAAGAFAALNFFFVFRPPTAEAAHVADPALQHQPLLADSASVQVKEEMEEDRKGLWTDNLAVDNVPKTTGLLNMPLTNADGSGPLRPLQIYRIILTTPSMLLVILWSSVTCLYAYLIVALADRALEITLADDTSGQNSIFNAFNWVLPAGGIVYSFLVAPVDKVYGVQGLLVVDAFAVVWTAAATMVPWFPLQTLLPPAVTLLRFVLFLTGMKAATALSGVEYSVYASGTMYGMGGLLMFVNIPLQNLALNSTAQYYGVNAGEAVVVFLVTLWLFFLPQ